MPVTRQAIAKHLLVLSRAGLVARQREGQEVRYGLVPEQLSEAAEWIAELGVRWDARLARLRSYLVEERGLQRAVLSLSLPDADETTR
jgi:DNA-binding transcriptional ArsR family regulator